MKLGLLFWCSVHYPDPGLSSQDPYQRDHTPRQFAALYESLREWAGAADRLGYDSFWLTEHSCQREGQEIVPNPLIVGAVLAQHTKRLKFGSMFHQVVTWHPLRLAQDFAVADIMSNGRMLFGAGRGSVQRECALFGVDFGPPGSSADRANRKLFEEHIEIIRLAWGQPRFRYASSRYQLPPPGLTVSGGPADLPWDEISLVPRPLSSVEVWQALISDETLHFAARHRHIGVIPLSNQASARRRWQLYGNLIQQYQQREVRPGQDRCLIVHVHLADTRDAAVAAIRPAHDERLRFLARQRPLLNYLDEHGQPFPFGRVPTLEESMTQAGWFVGTPRDVAAQLEPVLVELGVEYLVLELEHAGLSRTQVADQIDRFAKQVWPLLPSRGPTSAPREQPE